MNKDGSFLVWFNHEDKVQLSRENKILFLKEILPIATKFKLNYSIDGNYKDIKKYISGIELLKGERIQTSEEKEECLNNIKEKLKTGEYEIRILENK